MRTSFKSSGQSVQSQRDSAGPTVEEVGSRVELVLNVPDGEPIALHGEVVWANREPPMDMGIRYIEMDDTKRETLRQYIARVKK